MNKISIITINYNNSSGLEDTIRSVVSLDGINKNIEYLVIDGNSTDGSIDIINKYRKNIDYWVSESDRGIYNAMNKGILKAKGEYLLFMNSGDIIFDQDAFEECLNKLENKDIVYCDISVQELNGKIWVKSFPEKLNFEFFFNNSLAHQATFIKRDLFTEYGLYDESIKIIADWAFNCKCIVKGTATQKYINKKFSLFRADGLSSDPKNIPLMLTEKYQFILKNFYPFGRQYCRFFKLKNYIREKKRLLLKFK